LLQRLVIEPAPRDDFKRVRIGWDEEFVTMGVMPEVVAAVRAARDRMEALGATIVPVALPDLETTVTTFADVFDVEMRAAHAGLYPERAADYGPLSRDVRADCRNQVSVGRDQAARFARSISCSTIMPPVRGPPHRRNT
jgi:Asp-tRNA(Asn)/Glu-tRNA(Gln) amidotransferase A subunit family amidase